MDAELVKMVLDLLANAAVLWLVKEKVITRRAFKKSAAEALGPQTAVRRKK